MHYVHYHKSPVNALFLVQNIPGNNSSNIKEVKWIKTKVGRTYVVADTKQWYGFGNSTKISVSFLMILVLIVVSIKQEHLKNMGAKRLKI